jgi:hypothetical protein
MPSPDYHRYINSRDWKESLRRKIALHLLFGQDVVLPVLKAHDVEHLSYRRIDFKRCKGYEIPVLDLLPLNRVTHRQIITPLKKILRSCFGRKLGNAVPSELRKALTVAYFLRGCLLFWYAIALSPILLFRLN